MYKVQLTGIRQVEGVQVLEIVLPHKKPQVQKMPRELPETVQG